jgi:protein ImuA
VAFVPSPVTASDALGIADALPGVWRANQLASYRAAAIATGHLLLDRELPGGGWPSGSLIELLTPQAGIGEMRLLQPALHRISSRTIALLQPPHPPQAAAWASDDFAIERLLWVKTKRPVDTLWAAEQILRNGTCGALLSWQTHIRHESLRRLHLAAQTSDTIFWLIRPLACAQTASPAPLRLALRPATEGISIEIIKRRGPRRDDYFTVPLPKMPTAYVNSSTSSIFTRSGDAAVDRRISSLATSRSASSAMV